MAFLARRSTVPLLAACLAVAPPLRAQSLTAGALAGVARDPRGTPVAGALVTITEAPGGVARTANTDGGGGFGVRLLPPGTYDVLVERIGFQPLRVTGVPVSPGQTTQLDAALTAAAAADRVEAVPFRAGVRGGFGPPSALRFAAGDLDALPAERRELGTVLSFAPLLAPGGDLFSARRVVVDGVPFRAVPLPAGFPDPLGTAAFAWRFLERAEVLSAPADVEWGGAAPATLHAFTRRGGRAFAADAGAWWSGGSLPAADGFASGGSHSGLEGGATLGGPLGQGAGEFVLGAEVRSLDTPLQLSSRAGEFASTVATVALDSFGVALAGTPERVKTELGSAFARFDWRSAGGQAFSVRAAGSTLLTPERRAFTDLAEGGGSAKGSDLLASAALAVPVDNDIGIELRGTFENSTRSYDSGDTAFALTRIVSGALGFGAHEGFPGKFSRMSSGGTAVAHVRAGRHLFKAGGGGELVNHDRAFAPGATGEFTFSGTDDFARGLGVFAQTLGASPSVSFSVPRVWAFAQDTWTPRPGIELALGVRWDMEKIPASDIPLDLDWGVRTGIATSSVRPNANRIAPRGSLTIAPAGGAWRLRAEGGVYTGESDPGVLAEAVGSSAALRIRRGVDVPWTWGAAPDSAAVPGTTRTLTLLTPEWGPPRAARAGLSLSHALPGATTLHVGAEWRRTDFLPRRADLNLLPGPTAQDQYGRPLFGTLVQRGTLLLAQPGTGRRFTDFDRVSAIDLDGWMEWAAATVAIERRPATGLRLMAGYTFSRTRDNLLTAGVSAPGDLPVPFLADGADWSEGRSSLDVPHRGVLLAELRGGGRWAPSLAAVYRARSGDPFTAGFRAGVDANGDGSASNDPAFVDPSVPGYSEVAAGWSCLSSQQGGFAVRNGCRGPTVQSLDLRLGVDVLRSGNHAARLTIDGLNLVGGERGPVDAALYLVDPARALSTDAQGRVVVPLVANPGFGEPLLRRATGRTVRIGLQLAY
ncbi:MAG TPA: carboxypeptidase regulatory-like domain-containing protein [Longimicrobium sp.]